MRKHKTEKPPAYCKVCGVQLPSHRTRFCCDEHRLDWFRAADSVYARTNPPRNCELCGEVYQPQTKAARFCSHSCTAKASNRNRTRNMEVCVQCGCSFATPHCTGRRFCGITCAGANKRQLAEERNAAIPVAPKPSCVVCGGEVRRTTSTTCSPECRQEYDKAKREDILRLRAARTVEKVCEHCGTAFTAGVNATIKRFCSDRCNRNHGKRNRDARKRGQYVAPVSLAKVYARCAGICQICGEVVDKKFKSPHPLSATIDHIIPLAKGGTHEPANAQLAHFMCNSLKSDTEQLPADFGKKMRLRLVSGGFVAKSPELAARPVVRQVRLF